MRICFWKNIFYRHFKSVSLFILGIYTVLEMDDVCSEETYAKEKLPLATKERPSILNEVYLPLRLYCKLYRYV